METVGARVTARFVNVAAVSKTATASVTPTAVRINVLERVVFRTGTNIMDIDVTPIDTTKNYYFCLNSKKYIYLSCLYLILRYDFGCDMSMSVYYQIIIQKSGDGYQDHHRVVRAVLPYYCGVDGISVCQDGPDAMINMFAINHKISGVRG